MFGYSQCILRSARIHLKPPRARPPLAQSTIARLLSTLAVLEQREGKLLHGSLCSVAAASKLGGSITAIIAGSGTRKVAEEAAKVPGLEKVIVIENEAYDRGLPETYAPLLVDNIRKGGYTHVMSAHSAFGKNLMPRVAALLDSQQLSDVLEIQSEDTFVRPMYAGNVIATVQSSDAIKILTVRGTAFASPSAEGGSAEIVEGVDPKLRSPTEWVSEDLLAHSERPDLSSASKVVSGGRGLKTKADFDRLIPPLADALGAAIGASRAAVDSGFADNSLQVGQTGKNVAPELYLSVGISGAIQHLAGMKDSKVIAAINKDGDAPIFQVADVGLVGDLFEKVPELTEKLKQQ
ncbi:MAG: RNA polymerase II mediator complex subunit [Watsoniomyces obsoletus]|nr:MAG: RNA polymerase II mediator complex subunit [Watsoniomyces obsoletus]